jgi:hypothetical protein
MGAKRSGVRAACVIGVAALLLAACGGNGGGSGGGSCLQVQACGGSVVGTWTVRSSCESPLIVTAGIECPGTTLDESMLVTSGTLTYNVNMTYASSVTYSGSIKWTVSVDCIGFTSCDQYVALKNQGQPSFMSTCTTVSGTMCDCTGVYPAPYVATDSGTYSTSGNTITLTSSTLNPYSQPYCVQGSELHLLTAGGGSAATADLVASK